jgi:hypothetical protein
MLVERGLIDAQQLEGALHEQARTREPIGRILVSLGYISAQTLRAVLLEQWGLDRTRQEGFGSGLLSELERRGVGFASVPRELRAPEPASSEATAALNAATTPALLQSFPEHDGASLDALLNAFEQRARALNAELAAMRRLLNEIAGQAPS